MKKNSNIKATIWICRSWYFMILKWFELIRLNVTPGHCYCRCCALSVRPPAFISLVSALLSCFTRARARVMSLIILHYFHALTRKEKTRFHAEVKVIHCETMVNKVMQRYFIPLWKARFNSGTIPCSVVHPCSLALLLKATLCGGYMILTFREWQNSWLFQYFPPVFF